MSPRGDTSRAMTQGATCQFLSAVLRPSLTNSRRPVYEYPLNGQWIMLDMDDGYVLWTGIWKGSIHILRSTIRPANLGLLTALGNSKGTSVALRLRSCLTRPLRCSGHCQDDRVPARPGVQAAPRARWLPQNTGHLDALRDRPASRPQVGTPSRPSLTVANTPPKSRLAYPPRARTAIRVSPSCFDGLGSVR